LGKVADNKHFRRRGAFFLFMKFDLVLRNAQLLGKDGIFDLAVKDGKIVRVEKSVAEKGETELDAKQGLVLPTFVEPHVHLDKVLLAERVPEAVTITEARERVREAKKNFTVNNVIERIERVIPWALTNGVTAVRTHIDVDSIAKLTSIEAVLKVQRKYAGLLDIQVVAFPQEGLFNDSQSLDLLKKSVEMGADVVGGMPEVEVIPEYSRKQVDLLVELAEQTGKDLDIHCDVLPFTNNIEYFTFQVMKKGLGDRATADHLIALSYYNDYYSSRVIGLIKKSGMNVIANPCTMMTSGTMDPPPKSRGVTRIKEFLKAGVNLAYGLDNVIDPYNPFGDFDPLRNGWLLSYQGQLNTMSEVESVLRMPTYNSAKILRLKGYGLEPGCNADFNILNLSSVREALRTRCFPLYVVKSGKVIVENKTETIQYFSKKKTMA
jgi:cytosine deaminase